MMKKQQQRQQQQQTKRNNTNNTNTTNNTTKQLSIKMMKKTKTKKKQQQKRNKKKKSSNSWNSKNILVRIILFITIYIGILLNYTIFKKHYNNINIINNKNNNNNNKKNNDPFQFFHPNYTTSTKTKTNTNTTKTTTTTPSLKKSNAMTTTTTKITTTTTTTTNKNEEKEKLQTILDRNYMKTGSFFGVSSNTNNTNNNNQLYLWNHSQLIPKWMKEYFNWHIEQRQLVTKDNWNVTHKWLLMSCIKNIDNKCGGTADRLKPFVYMIRKAYEMKRILIIYWNQPYELEHFLVPPKGGIDWRIPNFLKSLIVNDETFVRQMKIKSNHKSITRLKYQGSHLPIIRTIYQEASGGRIWYEEDRKERIRTGNYQNISNYMEYDFFIIYHDIWRIFFTPTIPIVTIIRNEMKRMKLKRNNYISAHLRALYAYRKQRNTKEIQDWTYNAINCVQTLYPNSKKIFFTSELSDATKIALEYNQILKLKYPNSYNTEIVSRIYHDNNINKSPLHFEKLHFSGNNNNNNTITDTSQQQQQQEQQQEQQSKSKKEELQPTDFYDTFVDLYLLGMSKCLNYNRGGYGQWGLLIGYNVSCGSNQRTSSNGIGLRCNWTEPTTIPLPPTTTTTTIDSMTLEEEEEENDSSSSNNDKKNAYTVPLFVEPMD